MKAVVVVLDGEQVRSHGGVVDRGGRRWSRMPTRTPATNHPAESGCVVMVLRGGYMRKEFLAGGLVATNFGRSPCGYYEVDASDGRLPGCVARGGVFWGG